MVIGVIGIGLIGGSLAVSLKANGFASRVIGFDAKAEHAQQAVDLQLVDEIATLENTVKNSNLIILATPVDVAALMLPGIMDTISEKQVVIDVGSTKESILAAITRHPRRGRFVPTHPIWGTEYSGPRAAVKGQMKGKITVICNPDECDVDAVVLVEQLYNSLEMKKVYLDAKAHDLHAAYISHISHVASFALALTVLEKEKEEDKIFRLAGSGFESTVRLAKSNPDTWVPIFKQNRSNLLDVLNEQIYQLRTFKKLLEMEEYEALHKLISEANEIKKIIK
jgi:prephenate dehydrogenase